MNIHLVIYRGMFFDVSSSFPLRWNFPWLFIFAMLIKRVYVFWKKKAAVDMVV